MSASMHDSLVYFVGFLVVTGFGSIVTAIAFTIKKIVEYVRLEMRVERLEKDLNAAFMKIRKQEDLISALESETSDSSD